MILTPDSRSELTWWVDNIETAFKNILVPNPDLTLTTDASTKGWGSSVGTN